MEAALDEDVEFQALGRREGFADFKSRILNDLAHLVLAFADDFLNCLVLLRREMQILIQPLQEVFAQNFGRLRLGGVDRAW